MITMSQPMQLLTSHASVEWSTPKKYADLARQCMGSIDLDPASSEPANRQLICADRYHTVARNGLNHNWYGNIWLNPPYGKYGAKSNQQLWSENLCKEFQLGNVNQAILLINSTHGYGWYERLWSQYWCCLATERIKFLQYDVTHDRFYETDQAKRGQTFVYFGYHPDKFVAAFSAIGRIIPPNSFLADMYMEYVAH